MDETQEYINYIEEEFKVIREFLDTYDQHNSGSLSDDVTSLIIAMEG